MGANETHLRIASHFNIVIQEDQASQITGENHDSQANPCPDRETQTKREETKVMSCPDCGYPVSTKAKECPCCGYPLSELGSSLYE